MSEVKHTPGPWEITSISQDTGDVGVGHRDQRILIASVTNAASFGDMVAGAMRRGGGRLRQEDATTQFANARLIAASPEMLATLLATREWMTGMVKEGAEPLARIDAAIAKATGAS